jgi:RNA 3'-terminal phosphate cyclase (ATP)
MNTPQQKEYEERNFTVSDEFDGSRVDKYLAHELSSSRSFIERHLLQIIINGKTIIKTHYKVRAGDEVIFRYRAAELGNEEVVKPQEPVKKIYEIPIIQYEEEYIKIDGSFNEGGGQIIRQSTALAAILKKPIKIINIRANRDNPGLQQQHLVSVQLASCIHSSENNLIGAELNANEFCWKPDTIVTKTFFSVDLKTAGSVSLVIQTILPCLLFGRTKVELEAIGGTNVPKAPQIDYLQEVLFPTLNLFGVHLGVQLRKRGYFPLGGGIITLTAHPCHYIKPIEMLVQGSIVEIHIKSFISNRVHIETGKRSATFAYNILTKRLGTEFQYFTEVIKDPALANGSGIIIVAKTSTGCIIAGSALGSKGVTAEKVGKTAALQLLFNYYKGGCVDEFLQDQLIIFCALARGRSSFRCGPITDHTMTAIHFSSMLTGAAFEITTTEDRVHPHEKSHIICCSGIGFENPYYI